MTRQAQRKDVPNKRIVKQQHVRALLNETINELRRIEPITAKDHIDKARVLGYLSDIIMRNISEHELEKQVELLKKQVENLQNRSNSDSSNNWSDFND
ncbi:hypothetical protein ACTHOQ_09420 [Solibacillus silvestris]|uniref:hypothetical protein n=1 Tax=Solibacillus silvestris TaxID=76853 RepID=UPI003F802185